jgi:hypothetical protein
MNNIYTANWNVTTLSKPGKMQEVAEKIANTKSEIFPTHETRWSANCVIKRYNYLLYYSRSSRKDQTATGFIVMTKALQHILWFEPYNERLCKLRFKDKRNDITLINVHAPKQDEADEDNSITAWSRVLPEKLTGPQLLKKFCAFYGTRRFITIFTRARHPSSRTFILVLSSHLSLGLPSGLLPSCFPTNTLYAPLLSPILATCLAHVDLITRKIFGKCRK